MSGETGKVLRLKGIVPELLGWHTLCHREIVIYRFCAILIMVTALVEVRADRAKPIEIPFQYREGLIWVEVRAGPTSEPLHFLLDSGAEVSVLDSSTVRRLGLSFGSQVNVRGVGAEIEGYWPQKLFATAGGVILPSKYLAVDLSKLSQSCARPVDGLMGADFFRGRVVQLDFESNTIRLLDALRSNDLATAIPMQIQRAGLRVQAAVNGGPRGWLRVDTGCASALQWATNDLRPDHKLRQTAIGLAPLSIPQTSVVLNLGSCTFAALPAGVHSQAIFPGEAGLLGTGFLARFKTVTLDCKSGRIVLGEPREKESLRSISRGD